MDFAIVVISIVGFLPFASSGSLKVLRTFRILRPLRSINKLPAVRLQIKTVFRALPNIYRDFLFIIFIFSIFAIFGTNQFQGAQYKFCRSQEEANFDDDKNFIDWPKSGGDSPQLCRND